MATILIIDDDSIIRNMLRTGLEACGHQVYEAASGDEAITMDQAIDLVLIDHFMPGLSGLETAAHYRKKDIPFIFISSVREWDIMQQAIAIGAMDFIRKPFNIEQLVITVEAVLARARDISRLKQTTPHSSEPGTKDQETAVAIGLIMERFRVRREAARNLLKLNATREGLTIKEAAEQLIKATNDINTLSPSSDTSAT